MTVALIMGEPLVSRNGRRIKSSRRLWNHEYFTLTFPKPLLSDRKMRSRPSNLQITVPRCDERKLEEANDPGHVRIRQFLRKNFQKPFNYFIVKRQAPFRHPYNDKMHPEKARSKNSGDDSKGKTFNKHSKKHTGQPETTSKSKKRENNKKPKGEDKAHKSPSKSPYKIELVKKSEYKSETNTEYKDSNAVLIKDPNKSKKDFKIFEEADIESICAEKDSKILKKTFEDKSEACSKNSSNMDLMIYLEESGDKTKKFGMWLKNDSGNNSQKPSKMEAKKSSDVETSDSKNAKKDNKGTKKDNKKKDAKKDAESADEEYEDSNDLQKDSKKAKKYSKEFDKNNEKKDTDSTDIESVDSKDAKRGSKKANKHSKYFHKKKDENKDTKSTDAESESESESKKGKKDSKHEKKYSKKSKKRGVVPKSELMSKNDKKESKKGSKMKSEESSETESDWVSKKGEKDSKKVKRDSKKDAKRQDSKNLESTTDPEPGVSSKKDIKELKRIESTDVESKESIHKSGARPKRIESKTSSTNLKKKSLEQRKRFKMPFKKATFKDEETKLDIGGIPPSRESSPLSSWEPKTKRLCSCMVHQPPPKPRYAPLPEAKWIKKLL
ncbi:cylicin-1 [Rhynchonycteris naso]